MNFPSSSGSSAYPGRWQADVKVQYTPHIPSIEISSTSNSSGSSSPPADGAGSISSLGLIAGRLLVPATALHTGLAASPPTGHRLRPVPRSAEHEHGVGGEPVLDHV